jgi:hypothetical protein
MTLIRDAGTPEELKGAIETAKRLVSDEDKGKAREVYRDRQKAMKAEAEEDARIEREAIQAEANTDAVADYV